MAYQVIDLECPGCGFPVHTDMKTCPRCGRPVVISTFSSMSEMMGPDFMKWQRSYTNLASIYPDHPQVHSTLAFCHFKLKRYDKAMPHFEKAIEDCFDNADLYFYAAICKLQGKMAFTARRADIKEIEALLNAALMIEEKAIYYYFLAYIKYDFYERKKFNTTPNYRECLQTALNTGLSEYDVSELYAILGVSRPAYL